MAAFELRVSQGIPGDPADMGNADQQKSSKGM
jgi:hypothetical protein